MVLKTIVSLLFSVCCSQVVAGEEVMTDKEFKSYKKYQEQSRISRDFFKGKFLVYNCEHKHFMCVNQQGNFLCQSRLEESIKDGYEIKKCIPIKEFKNQKDCFEKGQYKLGAKREISRYCRLKKKD